MGLALHTFRKGGVHPGTHKELTARRGIESVEFRRAGKRPEKVALGPCWQRNKLEGFLRSVDRAMRGPQAFTEEK